MPKKQEETITRYVCDVCGLSYTSEDAAEKCAAQNIRDKFEEELYSVDRNPDFEESKKDFDDDIDVDDSEVQTDPENAASMDQVKSVSITVKIHGYQTSVYTRKLVIAQEQFAELSRAVADAIYCDMKLQAIFCLAR